FIGDNTSGSDRRLDRPVGSPVGPIGPLFLQPDNALCIVPRCLFKQNRIESIKPIPCAFALDVGIRLLFLVEKKTAYICHLNPIGMVGVTMNSIFYEQIDRDFPA